MKASICALCPGLQILRQSLLWNFNTKVLLVSSSGLGFIGGKDWVLFNPDSNALCSDWDKWLSKCVQVVLWWFGLSGKTCGEDTWPTWVLSGYDQWDHHSVLMQAALSAIITSIRGIGENKGGMTLTRCHLVELIPQTKQNEASFEVQVRWEGEPNAID